MSNEWKATTHTEDCWLALDGYNYEGIHATPERYYTEITQALFAKGEAEISVVRKIIERRTRELAVLAQEVQDIQDMLVHSEDHRPVIRKTA